MAQFSVERPRLERLQSGGNPFGLTPATSQAAPSKSAPPANQGDVTQDAPRIDIPPKRKEDPVQQEQQIERAKRQNATQTEVG